MRPLKPLLVERMFVQKHHVAVELFLDRDVKVFFATVELQRIVAPSLVELKAKVKAAVDAIKPVEWRRVIELSCSELADFHHGGRDAPMAHHSIEVEFRRIEVGTTASGHPLHRPFAEDLDEHQRARQEENPNEFSSSDYSPKDGRIPYSEAAWASCVGVAAAIDKAREKVKELFDSKDGGKRLIAASGVLLLPASTEVVDVAPKKARRG